MLTVGDLAAVDEQAQFQNDVQISAFEDPARNLGLLRSYLFTSSAPSGLQSSLNLLDKVTDAFLHGGENRFVVTATFGHGKSHLALAMLNFFSKPTDSPEMTVLLDKIAHVGGAARAGHLRDFKANRGEFLVVRVRGDVAGSLREQFFLSLEQAMREHETTRDKRLPFWFEKAERLLAKLQGEELDRANAFLGPQHHDVPSLLRDVNERRDRAYDTCVQLFAHLHGVQPNFGGEVGIAQTTRWVTDQFCGPGKPLGGVVILLDELSLYIERYAQRSAAGDLQDLLNGVEGRRGKVAVVAFAQQDPNTTAENVYRTSRWSQAQYESLVKELTRFPYPYRYALYSLLESVIDAYIKQDDGTWDLFFDDPDARSALARAGKLTYTLCREQYFKTLQWDQVRFDDTVTRGCFPLHPLTTALLCNVTFQQAVSTAGAPRTVLGFVIQARTQRADQPAIKDGRVNWVLPVELIEYFHERLPQERLASLRQASMMLGSDPATAAAQEGVLRALLMQEIAELRVRDYEQINLIAEMSGLAAEETTRHLQWLQKVNAIRFEAANRQYALWPAGFQPQKLEEIIRHKLTHITLDLQRLERLNNAARSVFGGTAMNVSWGHPEDWRTKEFVLTAEHLKPDFLKRIVQSYGVADGRTLAETDRGYVFWLIARSERDVDDFRQNAARLLDSAFPPGSTPPPVVFVLPGDPTPEVVDIFLRLSALESSSMQERNEAGNDMFSQEQTRQRNAFREALQRLAGTTANYVSKSRPVGNYVVPADYRASVQSLANPSLQMVLDESYKLAYRFAPPEFFTQYRVATQGVNRLRDAAKVVALMLLNNQVGDGRVGIAANPVAVELVNRYLTQRWSLLDARGKVQRPNNPRVREAWEMLDSKLPAGAGELPVKRALQPLMNPPYGFDFNTATLLFVAWTGYHADELQISAAQRTRALDYIAEALKKERTTPRDFLVQLCALDNVTYRRRDRDEIEKEVFALVERVGDKPLAQAQAVEILAKLDSVLHNRQLSPAAIQRAEQAGKRLRLAIDAVEDYDTQALALQSTLDTTADFRQLIAVRDRLASLPRVNEAVVRTGQPAVEELHTRWKERLEQVVTRSCKTWEQIAQPDEYAVKKQNLEQYRRAAAKAGLTDFVAQFDKALEVLKANYQGLTLAAREEVLRTEMRMMREDADLGTLFEYQKRLTEIKPQADATVRAHEERQRAILAAIAQLERKAAELQAAADSITSVAGAQKWINDYLPFMTRFAGSQKQALLEATYTKTGQLQTFYQRLENLNRQQIATPDDAASLRGELRGLDQTYGKLLGQTQRTALIQAQARVNEIVQEQTDAAMTWLRGCERRIAEGNNLRSMADDLAHPPAFLPRTEELRVESLFHDVQKRLDKDVIGEILDRFERIHDRALREECVRQLQARLEATDAVAE